MRHGKGGEREERRERKERGGEEGEKKGLENPIGVTGVLVERAQGAHARPSSPAIWRRLSEAKPRRSRGAASLRAAVTNRLFRPRPKMKERTVLSLLSKFEASSSLPHRDIRV